MGECFHCTIAGGYLEYASLRGKLATPDVALRECRESTGEGKTPGWGQRVKEDQPLNEDDWSHTTYGLYPAGFASAKYHVPFDVYVRDAKLVD